MSPEELGSALVQARIARGLTLQDVERDTRISKSYLQALEEGRLQVLPAPVYARAFMRTYAQYLGLSAPTLVQHLPGAKPEPELPPLPDVHREAAPLLSPSWIVAGVVVVILVGMGLVLFWNRGGDGGESLSANPPGLAGDTGETTEGAEPVATPVGAALPVPEVEPGIVPDLRQYNLLLAALALELANIRYVIVEVDTTEVPAGTVFEQSPAPGEPVTTDTVVTLVSSRVVPLDTSGP